MGKSEELKRRLYFQRLGIEYEPAEPVKGFSINWGAFFTLIFLVMFWSGIIYLIGGK